MRYKRRVYIHEAWCVGGWAPLFEKFDIAATWATVGFLFAKSRQELEEFSPSVKPLYADPLLSPYHEPIGEDEIDDPLHFAPSLIEAIRRTPRQELATHTFSHYYCLDAGQDRETLKADLSSALSIARKNGVQLPSFVFPKHQHNPDYEDLLTDAGIICYRGNQHAWMYRASNQARQKAKWEDRAAASVPFQKEGRLLQRHCNLP